MLTFFCLSEQKESSKHIENTNERKAGMRKTNELPFYEMIEKAVSGDKIAIIDLLKYYDAYISKVCLRPLYNKSSKVDMIVDTELKGKIQTELIQAILKFELKIK